MSVSNGFVPPTVQRARCQHFWILSTLLGWSSRLLTVAICRPETHAAATFACSILHSSKGSFVLHLTISQSPQLASVSLKNFRRLQTVATLCWPTSIRAELLASCLAHLSPQHLGILNWMVCRGAAEGEGLGNAFLSHIQAVDGIFHVCRGFEDPEVTHVEDRVDPVEDLEIIHK